MPTLAIYYFYEDMGFLSTSITTSSPYSRQMIVRDEPYHFLRHVCTYISVNVRT